MKKIIFINQYTTPIFADIINEFARNGYDVILITGEVAGDRKMISDKIKVILGPRYQRASAVSRIFSWGAFTVFCFTVLLFKSSYRQLFLVSNPPMTGFLGLFFRKYFRKRYSLLIYDIYPEVLTEFGYLSKGSRLVKLWSGMNKFVYGRAQGIFTISESMKRKLQATTDKDIQIIYNWADSSFIKPIPKEQNWFVKEYGLQEQLTVMYSGNFGVTHDLETLIDVARELKDHGQFRFVIIGDGAKKQKLQNMIKAYGIDNVLILPFQDFSVLPYSMTAADLGVVTLSQGAESLSVPSKTYYMLAAGCSLLCIATEESELYQLVKEHNIGAIFSPGDVEGIKKFLLSLDQADLNLYKQNARKTSELFTPKNAIKYLQLVEKFQA